MSNKRLVCVLHDLRAGGTERVLCQIANAAAQDGWEVIVLLFAAERSESFFPLDTSVAVKPLRTSRKPHSFAGKVLGALLALWRIRRELASNPPDVVLSLLDQANVLTLLASAGRPWPVVISERAQPRDTSLKYLPPLIRGVAFQFRDSLYRRAAALVVQSKGIAAHFAARNIKTIHIIPNAIPDELPPPESPSIPRPCVLALGRCAPEKDFIGLVNTFSELAGRYPDWHLVIVGDGPDRVRLEEARRARALESRVHLYEQTSYPRAFLREADIFMLSSSTEGFPNVLLEALAEQKPVVATECSDIVRELITDGENGLIVPPRDYSAWTQALVKLMNDPELRRTFSLASSEVTTRFRSQAVHERWLGLLASNRKCSPP